MSDVTQGNSEAARTETGEIKNQQTTQVSSETKTQDSTQTLTASTTDSAKQTEAKADGTKTEPKAGDKDAKAGPPEKYDFKAPEGYEIDQKAVDEAVPIFKELGLTQDQAQKLFDIYSKNAIATADAALKQYEATRQGWREEVVKAPDLGDGREGLKPEVRKAIDTAISAIGDAKAISEFKSAMDLTGVGDNPHFVRAIAAWGKLLSEGTPVRGTAPSPAGQVKPGESPRSAASALYPNLPTSSQR